jgi:hypothetical protein
MNYTVNIEMEKHSVSCVVCRFRLVAIRKADDSIEVRTIGSDSWDCNGAAFLDTPEKAAAGIMTRNRYYPQIDEIEEMIPRLALLCWLKCEKQTT